MQKPKIKRTAIDGWLNIDKPAGMSSAQVVASVKYHTRAAKVGHAGTLDPMATGILPIALGRATKTIQYLQEQKKSYRFTVAWGEERDTDDREGQVTKTSPTRPTQDQITALLPKFTGIIDQVPCTFSAVKVDGERAYDLARAGESITLAARPVEIYQFSLVECHSPDTASFEVVCGKGAYMRALARDLGREMACFGHLTSIRRLAVGPFAEKSAILLDELVKIGDTINPDSGLLPPHAALDDIPAYACDQGQARILRQGQAVVMTSPKYLSGEMADNGLIRAMIADQLIAIARIEDGCLVPLRVIGQ